MNEQLVETAERLGKALQKVGVKVAAAESCTSGLVSSALGAASDSGSYFTSGFVTYTDAAKHRILRVSEKTLQVHTAVSEATAREMATGAKELSGEQVSIAVTGYAGPDGGEDGTPAGTVWFGWGLPDGKIESLRQHFKGESEEVVQQAALFALRHLSELLENRQ